MKSLSCAAETCRLSEMGRIDTSEYSSVISFHWDPESVARKPGLGFYNCCRSQPCLRREVGQNSFQVFSISV